MLFTLACIHCLAVTFCNALSALLCVVLLSFGGTVNATTVCSVIVITVVLSMPLMCVVLLSLLCVLSMPLLCVVLLSLLCVLSMLLLCVVSTIVTVGSM